MHRNDTEPTTLAEAKDQLQQFADVVVPFMDFVEVPTIPYSSLNAAKAMAHAIITANEEREILVRWLDERDEAFANWYASKHCPQVELGLTPCRERRGQVAWLCGACQNADHIASGDFAPDKA